LKTFIFILMLLFPVSALSWEQPKDKPAWAKQLQENTQAYRQRIERTRQSQEMLDIQREALRLQGEIRAEQERERNWSWINQKHNTGRY